MPPRPGPTRKERAEEVRRLHSWLTRKEISARLGISLTYVSELLTDPDGEKAKARKERYRRPCPRCGTLMCGSDGLHGKSSPSLCHMCAREEAKKRRIWTREAIIEAIQEFAQEHGRPPLAMEWSSSRDNRYPAYSSVYRHRGKKGMYQPFASWADAIEAAGFPRPRRGQKVRPYGQGVRGMKATYVVLHEEESGLWSLTEVDGVRTPESAIEAVAARPGKYMAARRAMLVEHEVGVVSKYAVLPSTPGGH